MCCSINSILFWKSLVPVGNINTIRPGRPLDLVLIFPSAKNYRTFDFGWMSIYFFLFAFNQGYIQKDTSIFSVLKDFFLVLFSSVNSSENRARAYSEKRKRRRLNGNTKVVIHSPVIKACMWKTTICILNMAASMVTICTNTPGAKLLCEHSCSCFIIIPARWSILNFNGVPRVI